jgi:hypothetical protein
MLAVGIDGQALQAQGLAAARLIDAEVEMPRRAKTSGRRDQ